ncbi:hypothetical protein M422DRAFT_26308 [Sphaerobolus stellatus SS14]|nr:hypothetical protein M422DRAFT_26308 [Sphaerobolus stellatus SS14]
MDTASANSDNIKVRSSLSFTSTPQYSLRMTSAPVIIDTGSKTCRAGFAGELAPRAFVRTVTAHPSLQLTEQTPQFKDVRYAGDEALAKRAIFKLRYPVQDSVVVNWDSAQVLWQHIYEKELQCRPEDVPVLYTEAVDTDPNIRLQMLETQFECLHVPSLHLANTASLALVASGLTTGVVLDCGHDSTTCVAVVDGVPLKETFQRTNLAGKALTQYFVQKMMERGIPWTTTREIERAEEIREEMCYVPLDLSAETARFANGRILARKTHSAFEGDEEIVIEDEQYFVGEALFSPNAAGYTVPGLDHLILDTISKAPADIRPTLFQNIVLAGGTTQMAGLGPRLKKSLETIVPQGTTVYVVEPTDRHISAWVGGSRISSSAQWLTKKEFEELGPEASLARFGARV